MSAVTKHKIREKEGFFNEIQTINISNQLIWPKNNNIMMTFILRCMYHSIQSIWRTSCPALGLGLVLLLYFVLAENVIQAGEPKGLCRLGHLDRG